MMMWPMGAMKKLYHTWDLELEQGILKNKQLLLCTLPHLHNSREYAANYPGKLLCFYFTTMFLCFFTYFGSDQ